MDGKRIKQILARFGLAGLIAGAGLTLPGCSSGWSNGDTGAGGTVEKQEKGTSGWSGSTGAGSTQKTPGKSAWS